MAELVQYPASLLVEDTSLYPREKVDEYNVNQLSESYRAGSEVPPPLVSREGLYLIDGWHRRRAFMRVFGDDAEMIVEARIFANRTDMFLEAVRLNAAHGNRLSTVDKKRCLILAEEFKVEEGAMWEVLHVRPETGEKWRFARAQRVEKAGQVGSGPRREQARQDMRRAGSKRPVPLKGSMEHLSGTTITLAQEAGMVKAGGLNQTYYCRQVANLIEANLLDWSNGNLIDALRHLRELLDGLDLD